MITSLASGLAAATWLGLLTSVSPCPLATNVAAVSYVGRRVDRPRRVVEAGLLYALGRAVAYVAVGALVTFGLLATPQLSRFLQRHGNEILGPLLVLVGMVLLDLLPLPWPRGGTSEKLARRAEAAGTWGAALLGMLFALSFCPVSAALFFGSLLPLAVEARSAVLVPTAYGIGTALPVLGVAVVLAAGANTAARALERLTQAERWARLLTGGVFVLVGVWLTLRYVFRLF